MHDQEEEVFLSSLFIVESPVLNIGLRTTDAQQIYAERMNIHSVGTTHVSDICPLLIHYKVEYQIQNRGQKENSQ